MTKIDAKDLCIFFKSLEKNKKHFKKNEEEKFYANIDKIVHEAKIWEDFKIKNKDTFGMLNDNLTPNYLNNEQKDMDNIIDEIFNKISSTIHYEYNILSSIKVSTYKKIKSIIFKPIILMIKDNSKIVNINNIDFNIDSIIDIIFYIVVLMFTIIYPHSDNHDWIFIEYKNTEKYYKLQSYIYTLYTREVIKLCKNDFNEENNVSLKMFKKSNIEINFNIIKTLNDDDFFSRNIPNFILVLMVGIKTYNRQSSPTNFEEYLIELNSIFEKIDDKSFNNLNLFKLNKIGNEKISQSLLECSDAIRKIIDDKDLNEKISKQFIYGLYRFNETSNVNWTLVMNIIFGYLSEKQFYIQLENLLKRFFDKFPAKNVDYNQIKYDTIVHSINPVFVESLSNFFPEEIKTKMNIDNLEKYISMNDDQMTSFFSNKLNHFYENEFKSELLDFLNKYYKDNYNIENIKIDLNQFNKLIIAIVYDNFDLLKNYRESFDSLLYAWIYLHEMKVFYIDKFHENKSYSYFNYIDWFNLNNNSSQVISSIYDSSVVIKLIKKYINIDNDVSLINPMVFIDNNMLNAHDRIKFNFMECSGDILYKIVINHLKLNAKILFSNDVDYFSAKFQNKLCESLNISKIIQSNGLHFGNKKSFEIADYFEAFIYDFYLKFGYDQIYNLIYNLFLRNCFKSCVDKYKIELIDKEYKKMVFDASDISIKTNILKILLYFDFSSEKNNGKFSKEKIVFKLLKDLIDSSIAFCSITKGNEDKKYIDLNFSINLWLDYRSMISIDGGKTYDYLRFFSILDNSGLKILVNDIVNIYEKQIESK